MEASRVRLNSSKIGASKVAEAEGKGGGGKEKRGRREEGLGETTLERATFTQFKGILEWLFCSYHL